MRDGGCCTDKKAVYCHNEGEERGGEVDGEGRMDGCVERIFTSVNSRVIALITAVNNSKPLVGNSLREETEQSPWRYHTYPHAFETHARVCVCAQRMS